MSTLRDVRRTYHAAVRNLPADQIAEIESGITGDSPLRLYAQQCWENLCAFERDARDQGVEFSHRDGGMHHPV